MSKNGQLCEAISELDLSIPTTHADTAGARATDDLWSPHLKEDEMSDATVMLAAIGAGDSQATEQLLVLVYDELRRLAASKLAHEAPGQTLRHRTGA